MRAKHSVLAAAVCVAIAASSASAGEQLIPRHHGIEVPIAYTAAEGWRVKVVWPAGETHDIVPANNGDRPAWSPDGTKLVYSRNVKAAGSNVERSQLFVSGAAAGEGKQLTREDASSATPAWSPDGRTVAYTRGPTSFITSALEVSTRVMLMSAEGGGARALNAELNAAFPSWSPDGTRLAVSGFLRTDTAPQIYAVNAATGAAQRVTDDLEGSHLHPAWSPDGRSIAYVLSPTSNMAQGGLPWQLWVVGPDGSGRRLLVDDGDQRWVYAPAWTPDGRILFATAPEGKPAAARIEIVDRDGKNRRVVSGFISNVVPAVANRVGVAPPRSGATLATAPGTQTRGPAPPRRPSAGAGSGAESSALFDESETAVLPDGSEAPAVGGASGVPASPAAARDRPAADDSGGLPLPLAAGAGTLALLMIGAWWLGVRRRAAAPSP